MTPEVRERFSQVQNGQVPEGYKKSSLGIVPAEWTEMTLGDVYTERKESGNDQLPILTVSIHSGVSDGELDEDEIGKRVKRIEDKSQYKKAVKGDLVFNMMRAWQGAVGTVTNDGMVSPAYIVAEPNQKVAPEFMNYYMSTPQMIQKIHSQSYGVTDFRLRLYWDSFTPIKCCLPSIPEQQKIAELLTTQDKVIELKEKLIAEKQKQRKYLMQQLLTGKKRLPGFSGKWSTHFLKEIGRLVSGNGFPIQYQGKEEGLYPFYKVSDMNSDPQNHFMTKANNYIDANIARILGCSIIPSGAIVFAKVGAALMLERKKILSQSSCIDNNMMALIISDANQIPFIYHWIKNTQLVKLSNIGALPSINAKDIGAIIIKLPPYNEQIAIANILSTADREIELLQQDLEQEKLKKKALMQLLLTGIVRVHT